MPAVSRAERYSRELHLTTSRKPCRSKLRWLRHADPLPVSCRTALRLDVGYPEGSDHVSLTHIVRDTPYSDSVASRPTRSVISPARRINSRMTRLEVNPSSRET